MKELYNAYFGFYKNPFNMSPDPDFLFKSQQHEEALANLLYGVRSQKGFIVLTGEVGTGKTTLLECLRDHLTKNDILFASLFNSRLTVKQFFEMIAYDLDLQCNKHSKTEVLFSLNDMLLKRAAAKQTTVLIVDEAHNLDWSVLEEIRLLGNLETRHGKLLQIILAGQQELDHKLEEPMYRQLKQRIALRCALQGLNLDETIGYIDLRCELAGVADQKFIGRDLMPEIYNKTQGIPRLINAVCSNLLLTSFAMETKTSTLSMLHEVFTDMRI